MTRHTKILMGIIFLTLILLPSLVLGQPCPPCPPVDLNITQESAQQEWWMVLLVHLLPVVGSLVTAIVGAFVTIAVRKWGSKLDTDKQEAMTRLTNDIVTAGVAFGEEQARKALKVGDGQTLGAAKLDHAMGFVMERLQENGIIKMGEDALVKLIESRVHSERSRPDGAILGDEA